MVRLISYMYTNKYVPKINFSATKLVVRTTITFFTNMRQFRIMTKAIEQFEISFRN